MRLLTSSEMQFVDRFSIEEVGIPGIVLMENAGRSVADLVSAKCTSSSEVYVFCGPGNNGGDGLVVARHLFNRGYPVTIFLAVPGEKLKGDARTNFAVASIIGIPIRKINSSSDFPSEKELKRKELLVLVDALLGIGAKGAPRGVIREMVSVINRLKGIKVAVDIPTGVNADTGEVAGEAVKATYTVTFAYPKRGIYLYPGMDYAGEVIVADIGIPPGILKKAKMDVKANTLSLKNFPPGIFFRKPSSHKGEFGHLFLLAGSTGLTGAAYLASQSALKVGTGLVTLGVPRSLNPIFEIKLTEVMSLPLPETGQGSLSSEALEEIKQFAKGCEALVLGPGLSRNASTQELVREILVNFNISVVLDADGLNALAGHIDLIEKYAAPMVLTPHPGEMSRLTGVSITEIQRDRIKAATDFAEKIGKVVVLKGAGTVIADPGGECWVNTSGNPGMASGGTGDVLTGIIGGFMAGKMNPLEAAKLGVFLHGLAADLSAEKKEEVSLIAQDIVDNLDSAIKMIKNREKK